MYNPTFGHNLDMHPTMNITSGIFGPIILACAYCAQYWANKCCDELKEIKEALKKAG